MSFGGYFSMSCNKQSDDAQGQHDDGIPENTRHKHTSFKSPANATLNMSNRSIDGLRKC